MKPSPEWSSASIQTEIDALKHKPGALLPILHALQDRFGFIPTDAIPLIAASLQQTKAEIHGVISFYHHFRTTPPGRHVVQICRAEACQSVGARALEAHAKSRLGVDYHQTTPDREITLEAVYCLGNCACGPSISVDGQVRGRVTQDAFDELVDELQTRPLEISA
ncbi:formate dehydrogenase subunit gamma [Halomonas sp. PAMB 3264]|uniref:formate dehydrogenase subunit gamma n=1 Tax=Halomonas sp. PAMB 3264 TaxID=3075222 RepID=UPI00289A01DD|nr:formate dehydrogenase subunit gamma [Halomonas sp. PAMB 3264]WNL42575.1 formate dehydrogenase subunit gamma [Halomonas sp. PAMB 3264]